MVDRKVIYPFIDCTFKGSAPHLESEESEPHIVIDQQREERATETVTQK
jgi:hypothetical protein